MIVVKVIDIVKKIRGYDKKENIYTNGEDNAYPEITDRLINNSVTAKMCSSLMVQYLIGKGFKKEVNELIINEKEQITLQDYSEHLAEEIVNNRGVFIHVNYKANDAGIYEPIDPKVLPFDWCRVGEKDDNMYNSKILMKVDWSDTKKKAVKFDVYNPKQIVIKKQIENAGGIEKYKGQVFYYNKDAKSFYPLSRIDAVMGDCDSEAQSSVYKNQLLRKGFFGKTLIVVRPLVDSAVEEEILDQATGNTIPNPAYAKEESEAEEVRDSLEEFIGAEQAGGAMVVEMDNAGDKLEDTILVKNIEANIDADMFQGVEKSVRENILIAFNNLPIGLVTESEGMFSNSGEALLEMKRSYWENTEKERAAFYRILNKFSKIILPEVTLEPVPIVPPRPEAPAE